MRQFDFHPLVNSTWYLESQDGLCLTNCDGDLIHMNPAFLEQLGWDGWEGKRMEEVLPEWDAEGWRYKLKDGPERMGPLSISSPKAGLHLEGELVLLPIEGSEKLLLWALTKKPGKQEVWQKLIQVSRELLTQSGGSLDDQALNEIMHDFSGAFLTAFNRFDSGGERFKTVSLAGPAENLQKGLDILGFNPMKKVWDFDENKARQAGKENLTRYESLETLTGEVISQPLIRRIQSLFSLGSVVVIQIRGH